MNLEKLKINEKEYNKVIKKYPIVKDLYNLIDDYTGILESEYSSYDESETAERLFKQIFDLISRFVLIIEVIK